MLLWIVVFVIYFLYSQNNGTVNLMSSIVCKWCFFEVLCLLFTSFIHKTMKWWIWCHQQPVSGASLNCCVYYLPPTLTNHGMLNLISSTGSKLQLFTFWCALVTSFFHNTMEWWIWCHQQSLDVSGASLNCCVCYLPPSFTKQWNGEFGVINRV